MRILVTGAARLHLQLPDPGAARRPATRSIGVDDRSRYGAVAAPLRRASALPLRRRATCARPGAAARARQRLRPARRRGRAGRAACSRSPSSPTTSSPRTSGSTRRRSTPRSTPASTAGCRASSCCRRRCVYESATVFPTPEGAELHDPPPRSTFGFQKLATEYFARGAWEQYRLPLHHPPPVLARGSEPAASDLARRARATPQGGGASKLYTNHVGARPRDQDPVRAGPAAPVGPGHADAQLHRRRRARARHPPRDGAARGREPGLQPRHAPRASRSSTSRSGSGPRCTGRTRPFRYVSDTDYRYDVPFRVPDVRKAKAVLGFEAKVTLDEMLDDVIAWIRAAMAEGTLTSATRA